MTGSLDGIRVMEPGCLTNAIVVPHTTRIPNSGVAALLLTSLVQQLTDSLAAFLENPSSGLLLNLDLHLGQPRLGMFH
jgi:hypothetical protein